jgi:hypothetical protein
MRLAEDTLLGDDETIGRNGPYPDPPRMGRVSNAPPVPKRYQAPMWLSQRSISASNWRQDCRMDASKVYTAAMPLGR